MTRDRADEIGARHVKQLADRLECELRIHRRSNYLSEQRTQLIWATACCDDSPDVRRVISARTVPRLHESTSGTAVAKDTPR